MGRKTRFRGRRPGLKHWAEYLLLRVVVFLLSRLSWNGTRRLGRFAGRLAWLTGVRRDVTLENLAQAFPEWNEPRRRSVARACYEHFGTTFLELCRLPHVTREEVLLRTTFERPEAFAAAHAAGRGAILLTGHLGNWELMGAAVPSLGYPTRFLVATQSNRLVNAYVCRARQSAGAGILPAEYGLRAILRTLRANEFVAFLSDQDAGRDGRFVEFFGRLASTPLGPVRFARLARAPIILGYSIRRPDGTYFARMPPPIQVRTDLPAEEAELEATRESVALLEGVIREHPEQWFWMHRRWKTRPPAPAA